MKIWQWSRCLVCPVCNAAEHSPCVHVQSRKPSQYHEQRLAAGRELMEAINKLPAGSNLQGAARRAA